MSRSVGVVDCQQGEPTDTSWVGSPASGDTTYLEYSCAVTFPVPDLSVTENTAATGDVPVGL